LLRLVDNLLDFRKIENKTFNLRVSKPIFTILLLVFSGILKTKPKNEILSLKFTLQTKMELYIDRNLMDKGILTFCQMPLNSRRTTEKLKYNSGERKSGGHHL
jgi:hypothetical protein